MEMWQEFHVPPGKLSATDHAESADNSFSAMDCGKTDFGQSRSLFV
jgi:hypothetical protein